MYLNHSCCVCLFLTLGGLDFVSLNLNHHACVPLPMCTLSMNVLTAYRYCNQHGPRSFMSSSYLYSSSDIFTSCSFFLLHKSLPPFPRLSAPPPPTPINELHFFTFGGSLVYFFICT